MKWKARRERKYGREDEFGNISISLYKVEEERKEKNQDQIRSVALFPRHPPTLVK